MRPRRVGPPHHVPIAPSSSAVSNSISTSPEDVLFRSLVFKSRSLVQSLADHEKFYNSSPAVPSSSSPSRSAITSETLRREAEVTLGRANQQAKEIQKLAVGLENVAGDLVDLKGGIESFRQKLMTSMREGRELQPVLQEVKRTCGSQRSRPLGFAKISHLATRVDMLNAQIAQLRETRTGRNPVPPQRLSEEIDIVARLLENVTSAIDTKRIFVQK